MVELHVLRVFCGEDGGHGNLLGVVLDGRAVPAAERQAIATRLAFSETVFVDDAVRAELRIFNPASEMEFAGHPTVGAAWLLNREGHGPAVLRVPAGEVPVRHDGELTWIAVRPEWSPPFEHIELATPAEVDALDGPPTGADLAAAWAWEDEPAGAIRSRVFAPRFEIAEDEATGSAAALLGARLGRPVTIRQGRGSLIHVRPRADGMVEVGGRVVLDEVREL